MSAQSSEEMRWMVGVDARDLSHGAVAFARWLATGRLNTIYGVHVVEWVPHVPERFGEVLPDEVRRRASAALRSLEDDVRFEELGAMLSTDAEDGLIEAVAAKHAHALVIGRRAPRTGEGLVRLGRVARRLLRQLPGPVVVVPPDLEASQLGDGPVVLAVDLRETCGVAAAFAARVATAMRRPLVLVHAVHPPDRGPYVPADAWDQANASLHDRSEQSFREWADRHHVGAAERRTRAGAPVQVLPAVARELDACLLVTGSRELGDVQRLFLSSLGTELAASAPLPVAVVPPR